MHLTSRCLELSSADTERAFISNYNKLVCSTRVTLSEFQSDEYGGAENEGHENDGPSKLQGMKLKDMKLQDMTNISLLWKI